MMTEEERIEWLLELQEHPEQLTDDQLKQIIINDPYLEVALSFTSPSGLGAKIFVELPKWAADLNCRQQYDIVAAHIGMAHGISLDRSGSDIARAAFLGWDPQAYINPKFQSTISNNITT